MTAGPAITARPPGGRARTIALVVAMTATAAACIGVVAWNLIVPGPFDWHVRLPTFWQGGIEALLLLALVACGFASNRGAWIVALAVIPSVLYLRRHAVDAALLLDGLYLELVIGLGACMRRVARRGAPSDSFGYVLAFVTGFALWSVCAWTASALQMGSPKQLQWLTVVLAMPALYGGHRPFFAHLFRRLRAQTGFDRIGFGLLAAWLLVLFARSRTAVGADAPWYGLRPEFTLVPNHSVFESLALTSPVHYYPKLYEVFLLPLGILRDYATIDAMSVLLLLLLLIVCRRMLAALDAPANAHWPLLALVATLPALANVATYPAPDLFSTLFGMLAAYFSCIWLATRSPQAALWLMTSSAIACCGKLTAIPYIGVLLAATLMTTLLSPRRPVPQAVSADAGAPTFALAIAAATFATARTWILAGVPTIGPDPLLKFWIAIGFSLESPAGTLPWVHAQNWADVPALLVDWTFRPQVLKHIIVTWVGNAWLWLAAISLLAACLGWRERTSRAQEWTVIALMATGMGLAIGNRYLVRGGDGNYFLLALVPAILCAGSSAARRLASTRGARRVLLACIGAFALFQAAYAFISGSWAAGTRGWDVDFSQSPRQTRKLRKRTMAWAGLEEIAAYMRERPRDARVTGEIEPAAQFWLPARFENLGTISYSYPNDMASPARIRHFMRVNGIRYFVMPLTETKDLHWLAIQPTERATAEQLEQLPGAHRVDSRRYLLIDLDEVRPDDLDPSDDADASRYRKSTVASSANS